MLADNFFVVLLDSFTVRELETVIDTVDDSEVLKLTYDTTYQIGGMHCSILALRHPLHGKKEQSIHTVDDTPIFPLAFMVHERRPQMGHSLFFTILQVRLSEMMRKKTFEKFINMKKALITDREFRRDDFMPNTVRVYCWRHLRSNMKHELEKMKSKEGDNSFTTSSCVQKIMNAMKSETCEEFNVSNVTYLLFLYLKYFPVKKRVPIIHCAMHIICEKK